MARNVSICLCMAFEKYLFEIFFDNTILELNKLLIKFDNTLAVVTFAVGLQCRHCLWWKSVHYESY